MYGGLKFRLGIFMSMQNDSKKLAHDARIIYQAAVEAADPCRSVNRYLRMKDGKIEFDGVSLGLDDFEKIHLLGAGKATGAMGNAIVDLLGERIYAGLLCVKEYRSDIMGSVEVMKTSHPVPDESSLEGARRTMMLADSAGPRDLVFCLISGGASALWCLPAEGLDLDDMRATSEVLLRSGADIHEINTIRKHISAIKGGRLAAAIHPARSITLMISDVIGDDPGSIGSGPTVADKTTYGQALEMLDKYGIEDVLPDSVVAHLQAGGRGDIDETPKADDPIFDKTDNIIVASNKIAIAAAEDKASRMGYHPVVVDSSLVGEAREAGAKIARYALEIIDGGKRIPLPAALISGGETTVTVKGEGKGGRNQELALSAALELAGYRGFALVSAGTDGIDGPTDAAGAVIDGETVARGKNKGLDARAFLDNNDSYSFLDKTGELIKTGPTGTNVMDIQVILIGEEATKQ
jgi:glycerate 2-kinase